jgi:vancomycin aglycone glucosyltransferase
MGIPYLFAAYCPAVLPSRHHRPLPLTAAPPVGEGDPEEMWARDARGWNELWGPALNIHRAALGLAPVDDVRGHIHTKQPWLAADSVLAPWPEPDDGTVFQPGAWILPDERPLPAEVERFLDSADPPIYFGFGSTRVPGLTADSLVDAARAIGRRAIISRGWTSLEVEDAPDVISIGEANLRALFRGVAAVVHHGGAGTTTTAALAGAPQVIVPHIYDQHYFAARVQALGIGAALRPDARTGDALASALEQAAARDAAARAREVAGTMREDGAEIAARRLLGI